MRTFFGVYRVVLVDGGAIRVLQHGTTIHGAESTLPGEETVPLGYYSLEGPFGRFFAAIADRNLKQVGVIGLGAGELACYAKPGEAWNFHEIDPEVEKIARDTRQFHFLERCGHNARVIRGDARLTLQNVPDQYYEAIIIDAFSSDTIPMHLLTREALALYQRKLALGGIILFHISNRYLDLGPVIAALADDSGSSARHLLYLPPSSPSAVRLGAEVVAVGQPGDSLDYLPVSAGWQPMVPAAGVAPWTDSRSDIVSRIKWRDASPALSEN